LNDAVGIANPGGDDARLFIVEQGGKIRIVENGAVLAPPFLDLGQDGLDLSTFFSPGGCGERGLLGLTHPDYASNDIFTPITPGNLTTTFGCPLHGSALMTTSRTSGSTVLWDHSEFGNHNGRYRLRPDGYLYLSSATAAMGAIPTRMRRTSTFAEGPAHRHH
jgi:hypothetical protein